MSLYTELQRRRVFRAAAAYLVIAWLLLQVSDTLGPALLLPEWFVSSVAFLLILGFPVAIVFAWAFELTPDGLKREKDADWTKPPNGNSGKKFNDVIMVVLILALGYLILDKFFLAPGDDVTTTVAGGQTIRAQVIEVDRSIAVLPFVNMSSDKEQEYFSEGLSEELLNLLAKVPELRVAARTSSFSFKGKGLEVPEIASRLNVAHVLEGSVRKSGNQIRITAQLIRADNGYHVWSETYDRQLDNIFQIQEEIAIAVVNALKITLLGNAPKIRKTDPQAYQLFLEGQYLRRQITRDSLLNAIEAFKQAVQIDPTYVPAWADLADTYIWAGKYDLADQAIRIAISADPDYAYTYYSRGIVNIFSKLRFKEGIEDFQHALRLDPDDAFIVASIGKGAFLTGKFDVAIREFRAGLRLEPATPEFYFFLGMTYRGSGQLDDSETSFRKMLNLSPQYAGGHYRLWHTLFLKGEYDAALAEIEQEPSVIANATGRAITHYALGNKTLSDEILTALIENRTKWASYRIAKVFAYRGDTDNAFKWLNDTLEASSSNLVWILSETAFYGLHSDPRWQPLLEKINLLEYWLEMPPEWGGPLK